MLLPKKRVLKKLHSFEIRFGSLVILIRGVGVFDYLCLGVRDTPVNGNCYRNNLANYILGLQILHEDRQQIDYAEVPNFYSTNDSLMQLIAVTLNDASYCFRIANELQSIPLAIQITTIAGNVASRTFAGGRAERNEFLLLHAFHEKGYVVPDKSFKKGQQQQHFIEQELTNLTQGDEENQQPGSNGKCQRFIVRNFLRPKFSLFSLSAEKWGMFLRKT